MGFEHWVMQNFWSVILLSLLVLAGGHFAVVWLMRRGKPDAQSPRSSSEPNA